MSLGESFDDAGRDESGRGDDDFGPGMPLPDIASMTGAELEQLHMTIESALRRLHAFQASIVSRVESTGAFSKDQYYNTACWTRAVTNTSKGAAFRLVQTARMLKDLQLVSAAAINGELGDEQIRLLTRLHANDRCRPLLPQWEQFLLNSAREFIYHDFRQICQRWELAADPDGAHGDHETSRANRSVQSSQIGAGFRLVINTDALTGEMVFEIISAHAEAEYLADVAARAADWGDAASEHPLPRTAAQRMHDAFVAMCLKAAGTRESTDREPLVVIFTTPDTLARAIREYFATDESLRCTDPSDPPESLRLQLCETPSGAPVDLNDLAVAAIFGQIQRVICDPVGTVINKGRRSRLFTGSAREAVLLSGDRCTGPGCHRRSRHIQIDHLRPWEYHGLTDQVNAGPNCGRCNRAKHVGKFTVLRSETGWHYFRPDGTEIAARTRA